MAKISPTAVRDRSLIDLDRLKAYLKIPLDDDAEDENLESYLMSAKGAADRYCNNPFLAAGGYVGDVIPDEVETWVLQKCSQLYDKSSLGVKRETVEKLGTLEWDDSRDVEFKDIKHLRLEPGFFVGWF